MVDLPIPSFDGALYPLADFLESIHETVPELVRPTRVPYLIPDTTKFRTATGWEDVLPFERILSDTLEYWRRRVREDRA